MELSLLLAACGTGAGASAAALLGLRAPSAPRQGGAARLRIAVLGQLRERSSRTPWTARDLRRDACRLLHQYAALLQSGRSAAQAWTDLASLWRSQDPEHPLSRVCGQASAAEQAGLGAADGLRRALASVDVERAAERELVLADLLECMISAHALSQTTGAPLSALCRRVADSLEDAAALQADIAAAAAGPRLTALLLSLLPLGALGMGTLMGAQPIGALLGTPLGWVCLLAGTAALLLGRRWSAGMIRAVGRHA